MSRVSFDFDGTLDIDIVQEYAKKLIDEGHEVWITTSRSHSFWHDVIDIAEKIGILSHRIMFTNGRSKKKAMIDIEALWHLDDEWGDVEILNRETKTKGVRVFGNPDWLEDCEKLLREDK